MLQSNGLKGRISAKESITAKLNNKEIQVYPELENLTVTPSREQQTFKSTKYGYDEVIVEKVTSEIDENIKPENIKEGTSILGIAGQYTGIDTSNATATANDILKDKTAYSQNEEITGTIETYDGSFEGNVGEDIVKITDASYLFYYGARTNMINELLGLCKNLTKCGGMFQYCNDLTNLDLSNLNTSNVNTMQQMFWGCDKLTTLDLSKLDTSNVKFMSSMFGVCRKLTSLNLSNFNTSNVTNMSSMFSSCDNLTSLNLSNFNTSNVTNMTNMFSGCKKISNLNLSNFDMSTVSYISYIFDNCTELTNLKFGINLGKGYTQKSNNYSNYKLDLSYSTKLTHESLMNVINNLYDLNLTYDVANGGTLYTQTLNLGSTNKAKLTEEEIAIATSKGWNVT